MKTMYRVWTGDGSLWDGEEYDTLEEATAAIGTRYGWSSPVLLDHGDWETWSVYETQALADADEDGAYAPGVRTIEVCDTCGSEIGDYHDDCGCQED